MSSSPGTRPSFGSILAGLVAVRRPRRARRSCWSATDPRSSGASSRRNRSRRQGREINDLYTIVFFIAAAIFFLVEGLIVWSVIRYRRRPGDTELPPQTHGHNLAEIVWTVIPTIIVIFLFFISWQTLNTVEATSPQPDLRVKAVAGQFQWTVRLPAGDGRADSKPLFTVTAPIGPDGGLVLPAGKTTHLYLSSPDVIHAFYVPQFLFKRDVVPGIVNEFDLTIEADSARTRRSAASARSCAASATGSWSSTSTPCDPAAFQTWYDGKLAAASATPTPVPSGGGGPVVDLVAEGVKFDKTEITAPADGPFTIHFDNQDAGTPHDVDILDGVRRQGLRRAGLPRAGRPRLRRPAAARRRVPVRLLDPSDADDRHADGPVRSSDGDHRADARRLRLPERAVRVADDDRSQEDRDPVPRQLVHLLLPRRHPRPVRPDRAGDAGHPVPRRRARLQPDLHDARDGDDLPVHHPDPGRLRELRRAAPDRRAGHGVPADQRPVVLDAAARRHPAVPGLRDGRRRGGRLDELRAALGGPAAGLDRGRARTSGSWA